MPTLTKLPSWRLHVNKSKKTAFTVIGTLTKLQGRHRDVQVGASLAVYSWYDPRGAAPVGV
jgi:hypothetical protein